MKQYLRTGDSVTVVGTFKIFWSTEGWSKMSIESIDGGEYLFNGEHVQFENGDAYIKKEDEDNVSTDSGNTMIGYLYTNDGDKFIKEFRSWDKAVDWVDKENSKLEETDIDGYCYFAVMRSSDGKRLLEYDPWFFQYRGTRGHHVQQTT